MAANPTPGVAVSIPADGVTPHVSTVTTVSAVSGTGAGNVITSNEDLLGSGTGGTATGAGAVTLIELQNKLAAGLQDESGNAYKVTNVQVTEMALVKEVVVLHLHASNATLGNTTTAPLGLAAAGAMQAASEANEDEGEVD